MEICMYLSQVGLVLDIIGIVILAFFQTPRETLSRDGSFSIGGSAGSDSELTKELVIKYKLHRGVTVFAYTLIVFGFVLQYYGQSNVPLK